MGKTKDIIYETEEIQLQWFGCITRREELSLNKQVFNLKPPWEKVARQTQAGDTG